MIAPTAVEGLVVDRRVGQLGGHAAARRPADLHGLERACPLGHAAADLLDDLRGCVTPIGTSISPPRRTLPARAKTFVPLLFAVPSAAKASAPWRTIHGTRA